MSEATNVAPEGWLFWAKSDAAGQPHSLLGHLLDTGAVAELVWDDYLAPHARVAFSGCADGRGRDLFVLLAAWHDLGKATPAFQSKCPELTQQQQAYGLRAITPPPPNYKTGWHGPAGAMIVEELSAALDWTGALTETGSNWLSAIVAGHHGRFDEVPRGIFKRTSFSPLGDKKWRSAQHALAHAVANELEINLATLTPKKPSRGVQLALAGFVSMCDWIASNAELFRGLGLVPSTVEDSRNRARRAWKALELDRGWRPEQLVDREGFQERFSMPPRPLQQLVADVAATKPGLLVIEAPMGEGKTEAAFIAAEVLGKATGASGFVFAMPTQGTTDAMYQRVRSWTTKIDPNLPVALLHGKAMLNPVWKSALASSNSENEIYDEFGMPQEFVMKPAQAAKMAAAAPSNWLLGRHRQLLAPAVVGTVDQVLMAATRSKYVALRHAGLLGRVLIIDEVHAYDAYMGVFLDELLRWCARMRVPVVLMSATLAPQQRRRLIEAWRSAVGLPQTEIADEKGYPSVTACAFDGEIMAHSCKPHSADVQVEVELLEPRVVESVDEITSALQEEVKDGGCALAVVNTVRRAQELYIQLRDVGIPVHLLHGRFTASERADRTDSILQLMGPDGNRPQRLVVVATQIAEQSFDVDADVLYTDAAPVDLLLQRVGRLHRHRGRERPQRHRSPRVVITGLRFGDIPEWPRAFAQAPTEEPDNDPKTVYRPGVMLAAAAELQRAQTWQIPSQVPQLVAKAYSSALQGPSELVELAEAAHRHEVKEEARRQDRAATWRLDAFPDRDSGTLEGLHAHSHSDSDAYSVREADDSVEVCLVKQVDGKLQSLGGNELGPHGELAVREELALEVLGDAVRLRHVDGVAPLPEWATLPLLEGMPVLKLDVQGEAVVGTRRLRYDQEVGLVDTRVPTKPRNPA